MSYFINQNLCPRPLVKQFLPGSMKMPGHDPDHKQPNGRRYSIIQFLVEIVSQKKNLFQYIISDHLKGFTSRLDYSPLRWTYLSHR